MCAGRAVEMGIAAPRSTSRYVFVQQYVAKSRKSDTPPAYAGAGFRYVPHAAISILAGGLSSRDLTTPKNNEKLL